MIEGMVTAEQGTEGKPRGKPERGQDRRRGYDPNYEKEVNKRPRDRMKQIGHRQKKMNTTDRTKSKDNEHAVKVG